VSKSLLELTPVGRFCSAFTADSTGPAYHHNFMNIRLLTTLAALVYFTASAQLATNVTITNLQGKVFTNITLDHTNTLGVIWTAQDGSMGQIKFNDLSLESWEHLNLPNDARNCILAIVSEKIAEAQLAAEKRKEIERQAQAAKEEEDRQKSEIEKQAKAAQEKKDKLQAEILAQVQSVTNSEEQKIDAMQAKPLLMSSEEKEARDNILKALLDISSAASVGVTRNDYGTLLAKAVSILTFEKTKLSTERHEKYLFCAEKAIGYYAKANDEWSDYFKYDWEREKEQTYMSQAEFIDLARNGMTIDTSAYRTTENNKMLFYVPFKECLTLYWHAADIYVQKMHKDV
jgi:DNA segregation ATPase FtsK/SpoIIIE-like protein